MMEPSTQINVPVDEIIPTKLKVNQLKHDVDTNSQDVADLQLVMQKLIEATILSQKKKKTCSISTDDITFKSAKSIPSIQSISSDNESGSCTTPTTISPLVPGLDTFMEMASRGDIEISDEFLRELYNVNCRVDTVSKVSSELQERWCAIDEKVSQLESSIANLKNNLKGEFNYVKQYQMIDNLLVHNFPFPPEKMSSLNFCKYVADQFNVLLPHLPVPVKWEHISTAHPLPTKSGKTNVIIVRFSNRCIKDMIYSHRNFTKNGVLITEHLTDFNKAICHEAKLLFSSNCIVYTESCKIYINIDGKSHRVKTIDDVHKVFVTYCERIGTNDSYVFSKPSYNPLQKFCYAPRNSVSKHNISTPSSSNYRGNKSTGCSVNSRPY